jgi:hypothetical protein
MRMAIAAIACSIVLAAHMRAQTPPAGGRTAAALPGLAQINQDGFGDPYNSIAWSMLWFKDKLYVGTYRGSSCIHAVQWNKRYPPLDSDIVCTPNPLDLPLQAEIWRYTPETGVWERVYQAPRIPIPGRIGKYVGRDIGYRDMIVFREPDGTDAIYVSGVTAQVLYPDLPPPRLLRSTDGETFTAVPQLPGTVLGSTGAEGFRSITVFNDRLYVTLGGFWGDGRLLEAANPRLGNNAFRYVTPPGMRVFSVTPFNGQLYVGSTDVINGYSVLRTAGTGPAPYQFTPVVTGAAHHPGNDAQKPHSVISMAVFDGRLYAGTDGAIDVIRVNPDDSWDLIVGVFRDTPNGLRTPPHTLGAQFAWPYNILTWRMAVHDDVLFISTYDRSSFLKDAPEGAVLRPYMGAKLYATKNGVHFTSVAPNFLDGDFLNYGIRTMLSTPIGFFIGTANDWTGAEVWRLDLQQP